LPKEKGNIYSLGIIMRTNLISITTTATIRPEILDQTYSSFKKNLFKDWPCRVLLHIDPIGDIVHHTAGDVEAVARRYFSDVTVHVSETPNFSNALRWLWAHVETELFFNLEDDWFLRHELDFSRMVSALQKHKKLALLFLAKGRSWGDKARFSQSKRKPLGKWNGDYYRVPRQRYGGTPSLIRKAFINGLAPYVTENKRHEYVAKQLFQQRNPCVTEWKYGGYTEPHVKSKLLVDIGDGWRKRHKIIKRRKGRKNWWWEPKNLLF